MSREMSSSASVHTSDCNRSSRYSGRCNTLAIFPGANVDVTNSPPRHQPEHLETSDKTCSLSRPNQLNLCTSAMSSLAVRRLASGEDSLRRQKRYSLQQPASMTPTSARDALYQFRDQNSNCALTKTAHREGATTLHPAVVAAMACSSASSSSGSDDGHSMEGGSHHGESGFVSAASSVCLEVETPEAGYSPVKLPPNHRPKPSALNLPGCEEQPLHDDLVNASLSAPADIEVVVLADYRPCCDVELRVVQGQYATALFQSGAWLYVRVTSRKAHGAATEGYVPSEFCNLALLSPGTLDELNNDFDTLGDPFSPPKQLTVFNSLTTSSLLANAYTDSTHAVRYDVACVQKKSDRSGSLSDFAHRPKSQFSEPTRTTSNSYCSSPSVLSPRRHSYSVLSDTEDQCQSSRHTKNIVTELNIRTRKAPGRTRVVTAERQRPTHVQSDYETWTHVPSKLERHHTEPRIKHSMYESDAEFSPTTRKRAQTMDAPQQSPQSRSNTATSRSKLLQRFKNFRSKSSTLKLSAIDNNTNVNARAATDDQSPEHNAFAGRRAHAFKKSSDASSTVTEFARSKSNGYTSDTEVLGGKLSKSSKRRSIFSSLRRLNGSQTDTEDSGSHSRRRWTSLHVVKKEKMKEEKANCERIIYDEPPMRRQSSLPRLNPEKQQTMPTQAEKAKSAQRLSMLYIPSIAVCNFIGKPQLGQVSIKEGQRVFRIVHPNDGKSKSASNGWVLVMDPWTKKEGLVPQTCLSNMPKASQSTVL